MHEIAYSRVDGRELCAPETQSYADMDSPLVTVEVTFLSNKDGGRSTLPGFDSKPTYRPHIVIQDPTVRSPVVNAHGVSAEDYLGVQFIDGPTNPKFDQSNRYTFRLTYHPTVDYSAVVDGATLLRVQVHCPLP